MKICTSNKMCIFLENHLRKICLFEKEQIFISQISLNCLYLFVSTWELNIYFNYVFRNTFFLLFELMSEISHDMICKTKKPREIWQDGNICYVQYLSQPIKYQKNKCTLHWVTHCHCTKYVLLYVYMSAAFIDFLMFIMKCLRV